MQARAITAVFLADKLCAAYPGFAELVFLTRMDTPPIDGNEHGLPPLTSENVEELYKL
jgi:hypothetical protein